jgi:hypothetical protein
MIVGHHQRKKFFKIIKIHNKTSLSVLMCPPSLMMLNTVGEWQAPTPVSSNEKKEYSCRYYEKYKLSFNVILSSEQLQTLYIRTPLLNPGSTTRVGSGISRVRGPFENNSNLTCSSPAHHWQRKVFKNTVCDIQRPQLAVTCDGITIQAQGNAYTCTAYYYYRVTRVLSYYYLTHTLCTHRNMNL